MTPFEQYGDVLSVVFYLGVHGYHIHPLGGICSICENVPRASVSKVLSSQFLKLQFGLELSL